MTTEEDGATPRELLLESSRRNNISLLTTLLSTLSSPTETSTLLNTATDALGQTALHIAAANGCAEVLDLLLDQEGLEVDGKERIDGDTPLHKAVRWANEEGEEAEEEAMAGVELLVDAGADVRIRNKAKLRPVDLADPKLKRVKSALQQAEFSLIAGEEVVSTKKVQEENEGPTGSASDSD